MTRRRQWRESETSDMRMEVPERNLFVWGEDDSGYLGDTVGEQDTGHSPASCPLMWVFPGIMGTVYCTRG
jgi:hypothetical protein